MRKCAWERGYGEPRTGECGTSSQGNKRLGLLT